MRNDRDGSPINDDPIVRFLHTTLERSVGRVELEEVGIDLSIAPIINRYDV